MSDSEARDTRIDRAVSWILALAATIALGVGAWFFQGLSTELARLREVVTDLRTQVVVQVERSKAVDRLRDRVDKLEERQQALDARVARLELQIGARTPR